MISYERRQQFPAHSWLIDNVIILKKGTKRDFKLICHVVFGLQIWLAYGRWYPIVMTFGRETSK